MTRLLSAVVALLLIAIAGCVLGGDGTSAADTTTVHVLYHDLSNYELEQTLYHNAGVTSVAISPELNYVLTGGHDAATRVWSLADGELVQTLQTPRPGSITALAVAGNEQCVVSGSVDTHARV